MSTGDERTYEFYGQQFIRNDYLQVDHTCYMELSDYLWNRNMNRFYAAVQAALNHEGALEHRPFTEALKSLRKHKDVSDSPTLFAFDNAIEIKECLITVLTDLHMQKLWPQMLMNKQENQVDKDN